MSGGTSPDPTDIQSWMRDVRRRLTSLENRPPATSALALLGPGIDSVATLIADWNDDTVYFNGTYYCEAGADNAPDSINRWVGQVLIDDVGSGYQVLCNIPATTATVSDLGSWSQVRKQRVFNTPSDSTRVYSPWTDA
jgi:hypothetical protein